MCLETCAKRFSLVKLAFDGQAPPLAVLDQSHCTDTGVAHPEIATKALVLKELATLWPVVVAALPSGAAAYGPADTLLMDDSPYKALTNPEDTALHPHEWHGPAAADATADGALRAGGPVRAVLAAVAAADSVPEAVRAAVLDAAHFVAPESCAISAMLIEKAPELLSRAAAPPPPQPPPVDAAAQLLGMLGVR